jgi:hypothetical protein
MIAIAAPHERQTLIHRCSRAAGAGWLLFQGGANLLLGPHISIVRTLALGSSIGVIVGLIVALLQWAALRRHVAAGWWIPATTAGCTLGGSLGAYFAYNSLQEWRGFTTLLPLPQLAANLLAGALLTGGQWLVLRHWVTGTRRWVSLNLSGAGLAAPIAAVAGLLTATLINSTLGLRAWPLTLVTCYVVSGSVGSLIYTRCAAGALASILPPQPAPGAAPTPDAWGAGCPAPDNALQGPV